MGAAGFPERAPSGVSKVWAPAGKLPAAPFWQIAALLALLGLTASLWTRLGQAIPKPAQLHPPLPEPLLWMVDVRPPWKPYTSERQRQRGLTYYGSGERLTTVAAKLLAGRPVTVVTLGGSVTRGAGAGGPDLNYPAMLFKLIAHNFPNRGHVFLNKGLGGASSGLFSACTEQMVPADADMVVLEFTANEPSSEPVASPPRRGYERLIRKLLRLPGRPAVLLLHHYPWWHAFGDGKDAGLFYAEPEGQLTLFSHYYDIPSVSVRAAVFQEMQAGKRHFRVDQVIKTGEATERAAIPAVPKRAHDHLFFYHDRVHPSRVGHAVLAELLAVPLARAAQEAAAQQAARSWGARPRVEARAQAAGALDGSVLPPPMIPDTPDAPTSFCAMQEAFKAVVVRSKGFAYTAERPEAPSFAEQKWGWSAARPGSWAELVVDSRSQEQQPAQGGSDDSEGANGSGGSGSNATVMLSYLRSYAGMGMAKVDCSSGCACQRSTFDASWPQRVSLLQLHSFTVSQHERCRLRVTVLPQSGAASIDGGHKIMLAAAMVAHFPVTMGATWQLEAALGIVSP